MKRKQQRFTKFQQTNWLKKLYRRQSRPLEVHMVNRKLTTPTIVAIWTDFHVKFGTGRIEFSGWTARGLQKRYPSRGIEPLHGRARTSQHVPWVQHVAKTGNPIDDHCQNSQKFDFKSRSRLPQRTNQAWHGRHRRIQQTLWDLVHVL